MIAIDLNGPTCYGAKKDKALCFEWKGGISYDDFKKKKQGIPIKAKVKKYDRKAVYEMLKNIKKELK